MNCNLGVADLGAERWEDSTASIWIIALTCVGFSLSSSRDDSETRNRAAVSIGTRLREFTCGYTFLPHGWLEVMVVAHGVRDFWLEVLQLLLTVVEK